MNNEVLIQETEEVEIENWEDDIYEDDDTIRNIGDLNLNMDNLIGLLFDYEEEDGEISVSIVDFEHGGEISQPRIRRVDDSGDFESIIIKLLERFMSNKI